MMIVFTAVNYELFLGYVDNDYITVCTPCPVFVLLVVQISQQDCMRRTYLVNLSKLLCDENISVSQYNINI